MQHHHMANRHIFTDDQLQPGIGMQHRSVLHIGILANRDQIGVATQGRIEPDAGIVLQPDAPDQGGIGRNPELVIGGFGLDGRPGHIVSWRLSLCCLLAHCGTRPVHCANKTKLAVWPALLGNICMKLDGIKVVDLSLFLPGPHLSQCMVDHGAEVIKVEPYHEGEPVRHIGLSQPGSEHTVWFRNTHRGKRSLRLDLKKPEGRELLLRLIEKADVFLEAFRPGVMDRLGL